MFGLRGDAVKPFTAVWLSHLLVEVYLLMHPALVPIFRDEFNLSIFEAGLLVSIPSICRLAIVLPTGISADKFGSRPFVILSMLISGLSAMLLSQSTSAQILLLSLSLIMISVTLYHPPGLSAVSRLFPDQAERSKAMGLHGASGCIGQSVGTISLGLLMAQNVGWRGCYLLFSVPLLAWTFVLARVRIPQLAKQPDTIRAGPDERRGVRGVRTSASGKPLITIGFLLLLFSMGLNALANNGVSAFTTTYLTSAQDLPVDVASIIFGIGPLIGIIGSISAGFISARLGDRTSLAMFYLGQVVFLLGLITIPYVPFAIFSFLMYQLFLAAIWTPSTSLVASLMGRTGGGTAYSLFYFSGDALGAISPLIAALLIGNLGILAPFIFATVLLTMSAFLVRLIKPN